MKSLLTALVFTAATTVTGVLTAQRENVDLNWQKRKVCVSYGAVPVRKHGLHELHVGATWRMGYNQASTFETELPLMTGNILLAPGAYRVNIHRAGEKDLRLNLEGAGAAVLANHGVVFFGKLADNDKPGKKLKLRWNKGKTNKDPNVVDATLRLDFGKNRLTFPIRVVGATSHKLSGFVASSFNYPSADLQRRIDKNRQTPVVSLVRKGKPRKGEAAAYNLLISKDKASLVPHMEAPTASFGFGAVTPPAVDPEATATITWTDAQEKASHLKVMGVTLQKKKLLAVEFQVGDRLGKVQVPWPRPQKKNRKKRKGQR